MTNLVLAKNIYFNEWQANRRRNKCTPINTYLGHEIKLGRDNQTTELNRIIGLTWAAYGKLRDMYLHQISPCA